MRRLCLAVLSASALLGALAHPALAAPGAPSITSISPQSGPATGGTTVTVTGSGFTGATAVRFGGAAATAFSVKDDSTIVATAPSGRGTVDVTVTAGSGTSAAGNGDRFTYAPAITSVDPSSGSVSGGTTVAIQGAGFDGATAVLFGSTPATDFTVDSDTGITATAPPGAGTVEITVVGPTGTSGGADYTYLLKITGASSGPGGNQITLQGIGFAVATAIRIGDGFAGFAAISDTELVVVVPAGTDPSQITVVTPYGSVTGIGSSVPAGTPTGASGTTAGSAFPPSRGGSGATPSGGNRGNGGNGPAAPALVEVARPVAHVLGTRLKVGWTLRVGHAGPVRIELLDAEGRVVAHETIAAHAGLLHVRLAVRRPPAGFYRLQALSGPSGLLSKPFPAG